MAAGVTVTINDLHGLGYCSRGARVFFAEHGLNWQSFLQHGIASSELETIDDEMVRAAIDRARQRAEAAA